MVSRLTGALVRALLVMALVMAPSAILPGTGADGRQMAALVALLAGALTFVEYNATYPSLVEFRDVPPFNRLRFAMLAVIVLSLSTILAAASTPTPLNRLLQALGVLFGEALDFPYSPVRLATLALAGGSGPAQALAVRSAAGTAGLLAMTSLLLSLLFLRLIRWPGHVRAFNVWVNLPTFQPLPGGGIGERLERDARINLALGVLLPFLLPAMVMLLPGGLQWLTRDVSQTLLWVIVVWAYVPASLLMRGAAMARVAAMIRTAQEDEGARQTPRAAAAA